MKELRNDELKSIFKFDWLTVTFHDYYIEILDTYDTDKFISGVLGLDPGLFTPLKRGRYGYRSGLFFNNINIYYDGQHNMGLCLDISGKGINYLYQNEFDFRQFFILCNSLNANVTRIDVCLDLFDNQLDYYVLNECYSNGWFSSRWRKHCLISSNTKFGKGFDLQFGSRCSASMLRIYNKKVESCIPDEELDYWCRVELQTRDEVSHALIDTWLDGDYDDLGAVYMALITRNLRFVVPCNDSTITRWATQKFWQDFIDIVRQTVILRHEDKEEQSIEQFMYNFKHRCGQQTKVFIDNFGISALLHLITDVDIKNPDYISLTKRIEYERELNHDHEI